MVTSSTIPSLAQEQRSYMDMATTPSPSQKKEAMYDDFPTTAPDLPDGRAVTSGHDRHRFDSRRKEVTCGHDHRTPFPPHGAEGQLCPLPPPIPQPPRVLPSPPARPRLRLSRIGECRKNGSSIFFVCVASLFFYSIFLILEH